jgi:cytochrome P450
MTSLTISFEIVPHCQQQLRESISGHIASHEEAPLDVIPYISRCTLDILGLAGFNYDFNTVKDGSSGNAESTDELARAFAQTNRTDAGYATMQLLFAWFPPLRWVMFDKITLASNHAQKTMRRIGRRLVRERKRALGFRVEDAKEEVHTRTSDTAFAREDTRKDLLSLMIVANMSLDVSPEQKMSDVEVMHQIPTFMVAGAYYTEMSCLC